MPRVDWGAVRWEPGERAACDHCGREGTLGRDLVAERRLGPRGYRLQCLDVAACWLTWDAQHAAPVQVAV